jgi:hypothetical protein
LDWTLIWRERQLYRVLMEYLCRSTVFGRIAVSTSYHASRGPRLKPVPPMAVDWTVQCVDVLGGLIYEYRRAA